jgi:hypothetical protein
MKSDDLIVPVLINTLTTSAGTLTSEASLSITKSKVILLLISTGTTKMPFSFRSGMTIRDDCPTSERGGRAVG